MEEQTAVPIKGFRRILGKIVQFMARKIPFLPGKFRVSCQRIHGVKFKDWRSVFIGENVFFDDLYPDKISVGRNVRITAGVSILTHYFDTKYQPTPSRPFRFYFGEVIIGDNVFIGINTVIAKPVKIGDGAVIGANTVITKDVPQDSIVVGSPAKIVGTRPSMLIE